MLDDKFLIFPKPVTNQWCDKITFGELWQTSDMPNLLWKKLVTSQTSDMCDSVNSQEFTEFFSQTIYSLSIQLAIAEFL